MRQRYEDRIADLQVDHRERAWDAPIVKIARLANITDPKKISEFEFIVRDKIFLGARQASAFRVRGRREATAKLERAEKAVRDAYAAVLALDGPEHFLFNHAFLIHSPETDDPMWLLAVMAEAFATISNKSPLPFEPRGRTRPKGTVNDWQFQVFVRSLWYAARTYGGDFTFSRKDNKAYGELRTQAILSVKKSLPEHVPKFWAGLRWGFPDIRRGFPE
jgi:hypothetical protein